MLNSKEYFSKLSNHFVKNVEEHLEYIGIKKLIFRTLLQNGFEIPLENIVYYVNNTLLFQLKNIKMNDEVFSFYVEVPLISSIESAKISNVFFYGYKIIDIEENECSKFLECFKAAIDDALKYN